MNIIFHIDVNNAFLSWSAVDMLRNGYKEDIRNIPSIIGGNEKSRHGIVLAKSPVAKKYGIVTAETIYMARRKCSSLKVFPPDYQLYISESNKLYNYLCSFTPDIERYSIDECFLDLSGTSYLYDDYIKLACEIRSYINKNFGITVNIGIAENRLCAKMASDFEKPNKIHTLFKDEIKTKMWPLPVIDLFMVGKKSAELLNKIGIKTIGDLANCDVKLLNKYFKSNTINMINSANGIDDTKIEKYVAKEKSISVSETFNEDIDDINILKKKIMYQADKVGRTLRKQGLFATVVTVIFKNKNFVSYSHQMKSDNPISSLEEIYDMASRIIDSSYHNDEIRLLGLRLSHLTGSSHKQFSLFDENIKGDSKNIQEVIDKINDKYGDMKISPASMKK